MNFTKEKPSVVVYKDSSATVILIQRPFGVKLRVCNFTSKDKSQPLQ